MSMFSSKREETSEAPKAAYANASTVIARGVRVEGDFASEGDVVIEGEVRGSLKTSASLMVGAEASITADVKAAKATVSGHVEGNVIVSGELTIKGSARVNGDITAETMSVERGAKLQGKVMIGQGVDSRNGEAAKMQPKPDASKEKKDA